MIFTQFYLNCLAHASYLIGDEETRTAAVVDPRRDIGLYLEEAERHGLHIRHVFLTHFHADFVAGHLELRVSTIGEQRRSNYALQPMSQDEFVTLVTADQPDAPPYFTYDAVLNSKERPTLDAILERELNKLSLAQVLEMRQTGAQILDVRDPGDFAMAHLAGSINIGLNGQYATWAGTVLSRERPIVVIAEPAREEEATMRLGRIGFDNVAGFLEGGMQALEGHPALLTGTERVDVAGVVEQLAASEPPVVLDVRTRFEAKLPYYPCVRSEHWCPAAAGHERSGAKGPRKRSQIRERGAWGPRE